MLLFPLLSPFWLFIFYFLHCIFHFDCFFPFFAAAFAITTLFSFYLFFQLNVDYIRPIIISFKFRIMMLLQLLHLESSIISSYLLLLFLLLSMYLLYTFIILILSLTLSFYLSISLYPSLSLYLYLSLFTSVRAVSVLCERTISHCHPDIYATWRRWHHLHWEQGREWPTLDFTERMPLGRNEPVSWHSVACLSIVVWKTSLWYDRP